MIYSAVYSGGFSNTEDILLKMKFYIQLRDPSLKKINIEGIFNSFSNIWMPLLKDQMNKYLTINNYNLAYIPEFSKFFILAFIGYRHFPCGYPSLLKSVLFDYLFGKIFIEQIVFYISGKGNEAQMDAFQTFLHIIFPNSLVSNEEKIFANLLNISNSNESQFSELAVNILTNCCKYSNKEFGIDLVCFKNDFIRFRFEKFIDVEPIKFSVDITSELPESKLSTSPTPEPDTTNFERVLNQSIIENDQQNYNKAIECLNAHQKNDIQQHFIDFNRTCSNTFNNACKDDTNDECQLLFDNAQNPMDQVNSNEEHIPKIDINFIEDKSCAYSEEDEEEEEEECNEINDNYQIYIDKANELLQNLPEFDKIRYHIESLISVLSYEKIDFNFDDLIKPLKSRIDIREEKTRNVNMIGCIKYKYSQSMKKLRCEIARMSKQIQEKDKKIIEFDESQIQNEHEEISNSFKSIEPVLQKVILIKYKNKHFDMQSKLFWLNLFCINHNFFDIIKLLLKTTHPTDTSIYRWFRKIIYFRFLDFQDLGKVPEIISYYSEKLNYKKGERFSLSFDAINFKPGIQRRSLKDPFYGFSSDYFWQGQNDIQEVINGNLSQDSFLKICYERGYIGDYMFVFYLDSIDRIEIKDVPIFIYIKKNGFANEQIHEIKTKLVRIIKECGFTLEFVFSDGDGIEQDHQISLLKLWQPILENNCESYLIDGFVEIIDCFFNFMIPLTGGLDFICITDGMHLHKRIRYEIVNRKSLILARYFQGSFQKVSFYVPELQKILKNLCPEYVFCTPSRPKWTIIILTLCLSRKSVNTFSSKQ